MKITGALYNLLYSPLCRAYAKRLENKPADALLRFLCSVRFVNIHHYWPDFTKPRRLTEKIWARMLHDRSEQLTIFSDKLLVRNYVAAKVGASCLLPILWSGIDPEKIIFNQLPMKYVIKATHGCSYNIIVHDNMAVNVDEIKQTLRKWLAQNYCDDYGLGIEWGYKNVKPNIIIEKFIGEGDEEPVDYKFYCFSGQVKLVTVHFDRFKGHKTKAFDRESRPSAFRYHFPMYDGPFQMPPNYAEMVSLAESLSEGIEFIRVDLYTQGNKIYFGELTPYPGGISTRFLPTSIDCDLGEKWKMNNN